MTKRLRAKDRGCGINNMVSPKCDIKWVTFYYAKVCYITGKGYKHRKGSEGKKIERWGKTLTLFKGMED